MPCPTPKMLVSFLLLSVRGYNLCTTCHKFEKSFEGAVPCSVASAMSDSLRHYGLYGETFSGLDYCGSLVSEMSTGLPFGLSSDALECICLLAQSSLERHSTTSPVLPTLGLPFSSMLLA